MLELMGEIALRNSPQVPEAERELVIKRAEPLDDVFRKPAHDAMALGDRDLALCISALTKLRATAKFPFLVPTPWISGRGSPSSGGGRIIGLPWRTAGS